jgi:hypothetical protein
MTNESKQLAIRFGTWYSGMELAKVERAFERFLKENENEALAIAGVEARFCDLPIGAKYKYRPEHEGVFKIISRSKHFARIQRHCGRGSEEINDNKIVYRL